MATGTDTQYDAALDYARKRGAEDGENAAGWYVQDAFVRMPLGNTDAAAHNARRILKGIEDGDPAMLDTFPYADLSGEWANSLTGPQLVEDALVTAGFSADGDIEAPSDIAGDWFTDICDAYEQAFSDAAQDAIENAARAMLS